ncbi:hypothetical protein MNB_SV-12-1154 [hydrothermal vent metagenome]|uniref:Uncharacterized protein n=1 Tax=hydrothermal vent metagenome TaxID=652676 RepID=A0A1W1CFW0_9ZZZZ
MKKLVITALLMGFCTIALYAENNDSEKNVTTKAEKIEKQLQKQIKKEQKFAKEQKFYQGENYDLSDSEVDPNSLDDIPLIVPDYDFNMDDVYD